MLVVPFSLLQATAAPAPPAASTSPLADTAFALLVAGGALFWSVALLVVLILCVQVAREASVGAFLTLVLGAAILAWIGRFPLHTWMLDHPAEVLRWAAVYYAGGVVWASWRFVQFHRKRVRPYLEWRRKQLAELGVTSAEELTDEQAYLYQEAASSAGFSLRSIGQVKNLKAYSRDFVFWASYWPFALLGTLLRFVVRDAFTAIFRGVFAALSGRIRAWLAALYRDVHADRDAVLAKAEAYRARREGGEGGSGRDPSGGPNGGPGGRPGPRTVVVARRRDEV
jgi:hypothetical protein